MKRFFPIVVLALVIFSLIAWLTLAYADTVTVPLSPPSGGPGEHGNATLINACCPGNTEIKITGFVDAGGATITGPQSAGVYLSTCAGYMSSGAITPPSWKLTDISGGQSDTPGLHTNLTSLATAGPLATIYTIIIKDANGTVQSCVDVGMPSVTLPTPTPGIPSGSPSQTSIPITETPGIPTVPITVTAPPVVTTVSPTVPIPVSTSVVPGPTANPGMPITGNSGAGGVGFAPLLAMFGSVGVLMVLLGLCLRPHTRRQHIQTRERRE